MLRKAPVRVTLIDRNNYHLFQPLLYQVATAALNPGDIAFPIRAALRTQRNARALLGEVRSIDPEHSRVNLESGTLQFDYLIVATGATHAYFGNDAWAPHAPGLKSVQDAIEIRRRVLLAFEAAERENDPLAKEQWLTFVVVGAGPTGVELAGAISEIGRRTVAKDFRRIDPTSVRVVLVEGQGNVLSDYHDSLSRRAAQLLQSKGVEIRTDAIATDIDQSGVSIDDERIAARTVIWAAGVAASSLGSTLGVPLDEFGRVKVNPDLSIPGHPNIHVVGDLAAVRSHGREVPGVAPAAIQMGSHAARCIIKNIAGQDSKPFVYRNKGMLATIGRSAAVADFGRIRCAGFFAWAAWSVIHLFFLIGVRNRFIVFFGWVWQYITFQRGARLITGDVGELPPIDE